MEEIVENSPELAQEMHDSHMEVKFENADFEELEYMSGIMQDKVMTLFKEYQKCKEKKEKEKKKKIVEHYIKSYKNFMKTKILD